MGISQYVFWRKWRLFPLQSPSRKEVAYSNEASLRGLFSIKGPSVKVWAECVGTTGRLLCAGLCHRWAKKGGGGKWLKPSGKKFCAKGCLERSPLQSAQAHLEVKGLEGIRTRQKTESTRASAWCPCSAASWPESRVHPDEDWIGRGKWKIPA